MSGGRRLPSIAFNLLCLRADRPMGVERYVQNVVGSITIPTNWNASLFLGRDTAVAEALGDAGEGDGGTDCPALRARHDLKVRRFFTGPTASRILVEMVRLGFAARKFDVVLSVNNFGPLFGKRGQKRCLFIHDVWFLSRHYEGRRWKRIAFFLLIRLQINRSHHLFTPTHFSRLEINRTLGIPLSRISVAAMCVRGAGKRPLKPAADYFLLIGSSRPNKNVLRAVDAFRRYRERGGDKRLVVVGAYTDEFVERIRETVGVEQVEAVVIEGYISNPRLQELLSQCVGLVFVSLYEGYGIPVLEALLHGKPSVVSRGTACEEVQRDFGVVVDGRSTESIAEGYARLESYDAGRIARRLETLRDQAFDCRRSASAIVETLLA